MYKSINIAQRIKSIARTKNIILKIMFEECGLNKNTLSSMLSRGSSPKVENLALIADYLDVSLDYLVGRTDNLETNK